MAFTHCGWRSAEDDVPGAVVRKGLWDLVAYLGFLGEETILVTEYYLFTMSSAWDGLILQVVRSPLLTNNVIQSFQPLVKSVRIGFRLTVKFAGWSIL